MTLGENLQRLRKEKGLSQEEVAQALFLTRQSVSKWENDGAEPGVENLKALAKLYGVTLDELVGESSASETESEEEPEGLFSSYYAIVVLYTIIIVPLIVLLGRDVGLIILAIVLGEIVIPIDWAVMLLGIWVRKAAMWKVIVLMKVVQILCAGMRWILWPSAALFSVAGTVVLLGMMLQRSVRAYFGQK